MDRLNQKRNKQLQRKRRVRKKVSGTVERPRVSVNKSNKNIRIQVIDDVSGVTLAAVSTLDQKLKDVTCSVEGAKIAGKAIGEKLVEAKIKRAVFDRNGYRYHGIVRAIAESVRESGIEF